MFLVLKCGCSTTSNDLSTNLYVFGYYGEYVVADNLQQIASGCSEFGRLIIPTKGGISKYCTVITLDVSNEFNSASWNLMSWFSSLTTRVDSYLTGRKRSLYADNELGE